MTTTTTRRAAAAVRRPPVVVASVPAGHVYVRHLSPADGAGSVVRLPDARPVGSPPGAPWWPPPALEASWVEEHHDSFDVFHLHFGFDARTPAQLRELLAALRRRSKPLVYTVHDLRNPHHVDPTQHDAQLDVLVPGADALVTLTEGAAAEIHRRWGRRPVVLPHPHVVPLQLLGRPRPPRRDGRFVVGLHLKSLRSSIRPLPALRACLRAVAAMPAATLRLDVHTDVMTPGAARHEAGLAAYLRSLSAAGRLELHVHDYFSDEQLWSYLAGLDASVLPYRFGTHSGWLEACFDLGVTVVAPDCGYFADQRPLLGYRADEHRLDEDSLVAALRRAHLTRPRWQATARGRREERARLAAEHERLYAELLA